MASVSNQQWPQQHTAYVHYHDMSLIWIALAINQLMDCSKVLSHQQPAVSIVMCCLYFVVYACSPDLSCLKHHPTLSSLFVEAAGAGWQLSSLQLGYLVHVTSLKQLSLASRWCGGSVGHHHHPLPHQQALASPGRGSFQQQHAPLPRPGLGLKSPSRGGAAGSNR